MSELIDPIDSVHLEYLRSAVASVISIRRNSIRGEKYVHLGEYDLFGNYDEAKIEDSRQEFIDLLTVVIFDWLNQDVLDEIAEE